MTPSIALAFLFIVCFFCAGVILLKGKHPLMEIPFAIMLIILGVFCAGVAIKTASTADQKSSYATMSSFDEEPLVVIEDPKLQDNTQLEVCQVQNKLGVQFGVIVASSLQVKKGDKLKVWNLEVPQTIRNGAISQTAYLYVGSKE